MDPIIIIIGLSILLFALLIANHIKKVKIKELNRQITENGKQISMLESNNSDLNESLNITQGELTEKELQLAKFTVNKHSFRNSLNIIQSFANRTNKAVENLSQVLDYMLYESSPRYVPLSDEINFIDSFIEMNKLNLSASYDIRFDKGILDNVEWMSNKKIAPLISVNLIENAFKHGDLTSKTGFIHIKFEIVSEDTLIYSVRNKIKPQKENLLNGGLGDESLRTRLDLLYHNSYELTHEVENDIYSTYLKIKLHE